MTVIIKEDEDLSEVDFDLIDKVIHLRVKEICTPHKGNLKRTPMVSAGSVSLLRDDKPHLVILTNGKGFQIEKAMSAEEAALFPVGSEASLFLGPERDRRIEYVVLTVGHRDPVLHAGLLRR